MELWWWRSLIISHTFCCVIEREHEHESHTNTNHTRNTIFFFDSSTTIATTENTKRPFRTRSHTIISQSNRGRTKKLNTFLIELAPQQPCEYIFICSWYLGLMLQLFRVNVEIENSLYFIVIFCEAWWFFCKLIEWSPVAKIVVLSVELFLAEYDKT